MLTRWSTSWNQDCQEEYHNLRYADDTTQMPESKEELKNLLKEESEKASLKLKIKKTWPWHLVPSLRGK